jgi:hypothetical protein
MSEATAQTMDRDAALSKFGRARDDYANSYDTVPDEALTYVPEGEDYTLGGLIVHVTDSILHYIHVLDEMTGAGFQQVRVIDPEDDAKRERDRMIGQGFAGSERANVLRDMRSAHQAIEDKVRALPPADYTRKAPVLYGADATEPYPTEAGDILVWLTDHYHEHIDQVAELIGKWKASR